jgi:hypothetical protein
MARDGVARAEFISSPIANRGGTRSRRRRTNRHEGEFVLRPRQSEYCAGEDEPSHGDCNDLLSAAAIPALYEMARDPAGASQIANENFGKRYATNRGYAPFAFPTSGLPTTRDRPAAQFLVTPFVAAWSSSKATLRAPA